MKILQLCHKMSFPLHDGGAWSVFHTAMGLASNGVGVSVFAINTPKLWVDAHRIPKAYDEKINFSFSGIDTRVKFSRAFINLFSTRSYFVERFYSEKFNSGLIHILDEENFDIVQLEHVYMCQYIDTIKSHSKARVVLRPQNVEHVIWQRIVANGMHPFRRQYLQLCTTRLKRYEHSMANKVDGIMAISPKDKKMFEEMAPQRPIIHIPVGFDFAAIRPNDLSQHDKGTPTFYHLGSMDWMPNIQGMQWFIEDVLPMVVKSFPDFTLHVAGKGMPPWFYKHQGKNLMIDGEVADAAKYQQDKAVLIVPLMSGSGVRVKIIEAMALGKTVISTSIGAEGIPYTKGKNILIADSADEFLEQIDRCICSEAFCKAIGREAQILARAHFDRDVLAQEMIQFYQRLIP